MIRLITLVALCLVTALPAIANEYGAIAYSPETRAIGYSHNYNSKSDAQDRAMSNCEQYAYDCRVAITFQNACGALAVGRRGGWGTGWSAGRAEAQTRALNSCSRYDGGCTVRRWVCSK